MARMVHDVFLASPFEEFQLLRKYLNIEINKLTSRFPISLVDLNDGAVTHSPPIIECIEKAKKSDFMILLMGDTYGSCASSENKSYTHLEYESVVYENSPTIVLVFCIGDSYNNKIIKYSSNENFRKFQEAVEDAHTIGYFPKKQRVEEIGQKIIQELLIAVNTRVSNGHMTEKISKEKVHNNSKALHMNHKTQKDSIAISRVVEALEDDYSSLEFEEPSIDIKEEMSDYVESLEDDHDREGKLKLWVESKISHFLKIWESKYASGSQLIKRANTEIDRLDKLKINEQTSINNIQTIITDRESDKDRKQRTIDISKLNMLRGIKIDIESEKRTVNILMMISILLSVGTYFYFMQAQTEVKWSTISKSEKVAQVKDMILNGAGNQYSAFYKYIRIDDDNNVIPLDDVKISDLEGINTKNIQIAPKPTLGQSISIATLAFLFISFLFVMLGKVTALAYRKLGYPRWMFMFTWIAASLVMFGGTYIMSTLGEKQINKVSLTDSIENLNEKITKIKLIYEEEHAFDMEEEHAFDMEDEDDITKKVEDPEITKLKEKITEKQKSLDAVISSISPFKFWMMFLFFIAEIIFGSITWMSNEDYRRKKLFSTHSKQDFIDKLEIELSKVEADIETLYQYAREKKRRISEIASLESRIIVLKSKLYSKGDIDIIADDYMKSKISEGLTMLQSAKLNWDRG